MGAAQGHLAGAEIIEQGAGALYLRKVECPCLSLDAVPPCGGDMVWSEPDDFRQVS